MHLMYTTDAAGKRVYTLKKVVGSEVTKSAHPARFSPDDKYSRHRVTLKKRYGLLLTQQSECFFYTVWGTGGKGVGDQERRWVGSSGGVDGDQSWAGEIHGWCRYLLITLAEDLIVLGQ